MSDRPARTDVATSMSGSLASDVFNDCHDFFDEIHGQIALNQLERDAIDTPEFQRVFRISQLGFVDHVYHTANHTRGIHSIGACAMAKHLIQVLNQNTPEFHAIRRKAGIDEPELPIISSAESVLIRLGALLHDISHGPFSHDIEKKTHRIPLSAEDEVKVKSYYGPYEKHDDFSRNAALYVLIFDTKISVLARVLGTYSPVFWRELCSQQDGFPSLKRFVEAVKSSKWEAVSEEVLPALLFHLLVFEDPLTAGGNPSIGVLTSFDSAVPSQWGLGPQSAWANLHRAWYQPFRHDVIGNTLSADLLDYLQRDLRRLGIPKGLDLKLLNFYTLAPLDRPRAGRRDTTSSVRPILRAAERNAEPQVLYRCAIDLNDYKRGTVRSERVNDVFRLLDLRHELHEKAVFHRVVQSAAAMLSRALLILGDAKPNPKAIYGVDGTSPGLCGDDHFLSLVLAASRAGAAKPDIEQSIAQKLVERRVYRPLMIVPGDRLETLLEGVCTLGDSREQSLRALAAIIDSRFFAPFFCLVSWVVEKLLEHALDSETAADAFIARVVGSTELLDWVLAGVKSKRVIFWTTPYKQLYKDPALLIRVGDAVTTIDGIRGLANLPTVRADDLRALQERVAAGMVDAEKKYESLWKFYVFLSDGLFYTGVLARLLPDHPCATSVDAHKMHLAAGQNLAIRAVRAAWDRWESQRRQGRVLELDSRISAGELREFLEIFAHEGYRERGRYRHISERVSAVALDQYLHGQPPLNCRDVRYKFDRVGAWRTALEGRGLAAPEQEVLIELLRSTEVNLEHLTHAEILEVATRFQVVQTELSQCVKGRAAREEPLFPSDLLQAAWRAEPGWAKAWLGDGSTAA